MSSVPPDATAPPEPGQGPPFRYTAELAGRLEAKWQDVWERQGTFAAPNPGEPGFDAARPKKFVLDMFPYPSGVGLHVGHPLGYIATDIYARYLRMTGHNVLHAMGFDAFGLPAEQYAVQTGTHPRVTTERNIATMRAQLRRLGLAHDRRRSVATTDPEFYKWTQWIFLKIYDSWYDEGASREGGGGRGRARPIAELVRALESGEVAPRAGRPWAKLSEAERRDEIDARRLAYLAEVPVNWCPMLGTVLANEEVTPEGRSERGNYPVFKRPLKQWMMRITAYAGRLADDLSLVDWPEPIKLMQRNWIGRSEGAFVDFPCGHRRLRVFTTRPDTLFGAAYLVLSPQHAVVGELVPDKYGATSPRAWRGHFDGAEDLIARDASPRDMVAAYLAFAAARSDQQRQEARDKSGVFTGAYAINPVTGGRIPVFIADYVLMGYGTGAIMAVPGHDERDHEFAERFGLPIVEVVSRGDGSTPTGPFTGDGVTLNSSNLDISLDGLPTAMAKARIIAWLEAKGFGKGATTYKLRDWLFSRQRYWGEPFPIVYDEEGRTHALPESMLPVLLPELDHFHPESSDDPDAPPRPPLARAKDWVAVTLDLGDGGGDGGGGAGAQRYTRETNTMPNWAGSCWYYLRYLDPENTRRFVGQEAERYWMAGARGTGSENRGTQAGGVDLYVGGVEHAVLHLLYARFWHKVLFDLGLVSTPEPFQKLYNQGYIQAAAYTDERGMYVEAAEVEERDGGFFHQGKAVGREYGKMGKSLKNAVTPDDIFHEYGCDTLRVYEMAMGPLEASKPWNTRDIVGAYRFLQRAWRHLIDEETGRPRMTDAPATPETLRLLHKTIVAVRRDVEALSFNTAVTKLIELNNHFGTLGEGVPREAAAPFVRMLAPFAPHIAEELNSLLFGSGADDQATEPRSLAYARFPIADERLAADDQIEVPVSIMGKVRSRVMVAPTIEPAALEAAALADPKIQELIAGKTIKKVIVVPGKMVNIVAG